MEEFKPDNMKQQHIEYQKELKERFESEVNFVLGIRNNEILPGKNKYESKQCFLNTMEELKKNGDVFTEHEVVAEAAKRLGYEVREITPKRWGIGFPRSNPW